MELNELKEKLNGYKKGTFVKMSYKSVKQYGTDTVEKVSNGVYRLGIKYGNMAQNKNKVIQPLKSGEWLSGFEHYIIVTEKTDKKTGLTAITNKLRVYPTKVKTAVKWLLNGVETTIEELTEKGYYKPSMHSACFDIFVHNLISIK